MYSEDNAGKLPPVRVNCNTDLATHWCQFPVELVEQRYLGAGSKPDMAANMEDVFNPDHTYKYAAPGPQLLNNAPGGNYQFWVPNDLPNCASTNGQYYSHPAVTGNLKDTSAKFYETEWLLNAQLTFKPSDFMNVRLAAYQALARPDFNYRLTQVIARNSSTAVPLGVPSDYGTAVYYGDPSLTACERRGIMKSTPPSSAIPLVC